MCWRLACQPGFCLRDWLAWSVAGMHPAMSELLRALGHTHVLVCLSHGRARPTTRLALFLAQALHFLEILVGPPCRRICMKIWSLNVAAAVIEPILQALHFVEILVGPKCAELTVERPQQYYFDRECCCWLSDFGNGVHVIANHSSWSHNCAAAMLGHVKTCCAMPCQVVPFGALPWCMLHMRCRPTPCHAMRMHLW